MKADEGGENPYADVEHFLGSIVVIQDGTKSGTVAAFKLVDGQQRLTTISLFLKALAAHIQSKEPQLAKKIEKLLVNSDEQGDLFFKLLPTVKYGYMRWPPKIGPPVKMDFSRSAWEKIADYESQAKAA